MLPCSDRDTIVVLPSLTPEKVGLPGSELPPRVVLWRHDVYNGSASTLCSVFWKKNKLFTKWQLTIEYETKKYNLK